MEANIALNADRTFHMSIATNGLAGKIPPLVVVSGTWKINNDELIWAATHSTWQKEVFTGAMDSESIVSMDSNSFRTVNKKGQARLYLRTRKTIEGGR